MKADGNAPLVEQTARGLGVRVGGSDADVPVGADGNIAPGTGGMSVAPDDPLFLPQHRRPRSLGGTGKDPVWRLFQHSLPLTLIFVAEREEHGVIGSAIVATPSQFRDALASTAPDWTNIT